jgi:hypothetical protein
VGLPVEGEEVVRMQKMLFGRAQDGLVEAEVDYSLTRGRERSRRGRILAEVEVEDGVAMVGVARG